MTDLNFANYLTETKSLIEARLTTFFEKQQADLFLPWPIVENLIHRLAAMHQGGKKVRAVLVRLGYELAGGDNLDAIVSLAASYEILHSFLLIHDDVIDQAPLRRGMPTLHVQFKKLHQLNHLRGDAAHYGEALAITLGDIDAFLALKLLLESDIAPENKQAVLNFLVDVLIKTGFGQVLDIDLSLRAQKLESDIITIHTLKTAQYTVVGPMLAGAIAAGADVNLQNLLKEAVLPLGIAFQIQDDILGVFGDEKVTGKSSKSDIAEGKNTLLIAYALKHASKADVDKLNQIYGKRPVSDSNLKTVQAIFKRCGSLEYSQKQLQDLLAKSLNLIERLPIDQSYRQLLTQMANLLTNREQ